MDLPGNKVITREIGRLREKWQCHSNTCGQYHCYVHPEEKTHFALGHSHFNIWASAIVKKNILYAVDIQICSLIVRSRAMTQQLLKNCQIIRHSILLPTTQRQNLQPFFSVVRPLKLQHLLLGQSSTSSPGLNLCHFSAKIWLYLLRSLLLYLSIPMALFSPQISNRLIPTFSMTFVFLSPNILVRFSEQGFAALNQLCYVFLSDLKGMAFKPSEIASIQDAIEFGLLLSDKCCFSLLICHVKHQIVL